MSNPYPAEFRERALRMLAEARPDHLSDFAAANHVAGRLGVNPEMLRLWNTRAAIDAGREPGTSSEAQVGAKYSKARLFTYFFLLKLLYQSCLVEPSV
jgi:transposase